VKFEKVPDGWLPRCRPRTRSPLASGRRTAATSPDAVPPTGAVPRHGRTRGVVFAGPTGG